MSLLFVAAAGGTWLVAPLAGAEYALGCGAAPLRVVNPSALPARAQAVLFRLAGRAHPARWALVASAAAVVCVNGSPLLTGLRVLQDRDEVRLGDHHFYFSAERLAQVVPFPALDRPAMCARCGGVLAPSEPAVCCPQCAAWCHASAELPCWRYAPTCPRCEQRTDAEDYTWSPACL